MSGVSDARARELAHRILKLKLDAREVPAFLGAEGVGRESWPTIMDALRADLERQRMALAAQAADIELSRRMFACALVDAGYADTESEALALVDLLLADGAGGVQ